MKEIVFSYGEREDLFGILSLPDAQGPAPTPVIIPNTGLEHRVGPNRLHVHLCRAIADAGFPALRLDLSSMGDSASGEPGAVADSTRDLQRALDALELRGFGSRFMVAGLCSGAHDAHLITRADERIIGCAAIDGYVYPTSRYRLNYIAQRALDPVRIGRRLARAVRPRTEDEQFEEARDELEYYRQPTLPEMHRDLAEFFRRGLSLAYVYTGQIQHRYNYADQLADALPELRGYGQAEVHYLAMADHTFSRTSMRSELVGVVLAFVRRCAARQLPSVAQ